MVWRLKKKVICLNRRELFGREMGLRKEGLRGGPGKGGSNWGNRFMNNIDV